MAATLANRASAPERTGTLFRISFNYFRNSSTTSSTVSPAAASGGAKRSKRKKKNLFEVAQFLPNWGIGYHMAKTHWAGVSYQITKINLYKNGRHGKAWGIVHKDGILNSQVFGPNKKDCPVVAICETEVEFLPIMESNRHFRRQGC